MDWIASRRARRAGELLQAQGSLTKSEPYENNVGFSDRSDVPIEPRLSEQWFLRYPKTKEALAVVRDHLIRFFPAHWEKVYAQWLENIQDWCISRQVWWGHRIPAWYRNRTSEIRVQLESPGAEGWTQDPDTLDTWFSSWLWAYETMDAETRQKFYPTSVLVTGPDIIFFWVARMIIAGLEFKPGTSDKTEDNIPFRDVFFTGLIRDQQGRKMSKSLGNSPDPLDLIEKYGADGLRFGLMRIAPSGRIFAFEEKQIEEGRNFATKLWNAARFRQMHGPCAAEPAIENASLSIYSIEVLARLNETIAAIEQAYREYKFNEVAQRLYDFFWSDYCDWFVEAAKTEIFGDDEARKRSALAVMDYVLSAVVRLAASVYAAYYGGVVVAARFRQDRRFNSPLRRRRLQLARTDIAEKRALASAIYNTVQAGRNLRAESKIPSNKKARFVLRAPNELLREELPTMARLLNAEDVADSIPDYAAAAGVPVAATPLGELFLLISETRQRSGTRATRKRDRKNRKRIAEGERQAL